MLYIHILHTWVNRSITNVVLLANGLRRIFALLSLHKQKLAQLQPQVFLSFSLSLPSLFNFLVDTFPSLLILQVGCWGWCWCWCWCRAGWGLGLVLVSILLFSFLIIFSLFGPFWWVCSALLLSWSALLLSWSALLLSCSALLLSCSALLLCSSTPLLFCSALLLSYSPALLLSCSPAFFFSSNFRIFGYLVSPFLFSYLSSLTPSYTSSLLPFSSSSSSLNFRILPLL